jgi:DNA repair exonuclease SbcCD ATPase subunit
MAGLWQMVFRQLQPRKKRMVPQNVRLLNRNKPEESGQMHTQEQERTQKDVENEDLLISQIDEFREKAKQLQVLLEAKESKAAELQSLVDERAGKAQELEHILTERQEEADKIVTEFGRKVDALADKVTTKMAEIEAGLSGQVADIRKTSEEQIALNRRMNEEQTASNRKLNEEQFLEEQAIANKKLSEGQIAEVKELLENATSQLESIKTDLSEKVHTENVKCYRNIQDLFNEFDSKIEKMDEMEGGVDSVKGYVKLLSWFSILNFVVLIIFILYSMGVFHF